VTRVRAIMLLSIPLWSACVRRPAPVTPATASSPCAKANGIGRVQLRISTSPTVPESTEALVRLESESERSTVRINAVLGSTFELRPGSYRLTISVPGYSSVTESATVTCGSNRTVTAALSKKR
jgi:hypothetical protein